MKLCSLLHTTSRKRLTVAIYLFKPESFYLKLIVWTLRYTNCWSVLCPLKTHKSWHDFKRGSMSPIILLTGYRYKCGGNSSFSIIRQTHKTEMKITWFIVIAPFQLLGDTFSIMLMNPSVWPVFCVLLRLKQ